MSRRVIVSFAALLVAACFTTAAAHAGLPPPLSLTRGGDGTVAAVRGDLSPAGLPGAGSGIVSWRDYDGDGNQDFLLLAGTATGTIARVYRNVGGGIYRAAGTCVTTADTTICEGDQSTGVKIPSGSSPIYLWVRNLTTDIAPAEGVHGVEVTRTGGARIEIVFLGGGHAIVTQGDGAHGFDAYTRGNDGATGSNDYGGFNPFYPVSHGGAGGAGGAGGKIDITNDASITTSGDGAHGIFAMSQGGNGGRGGHAGAIAYASGGNGGVGGRGGDVNVANQGTVTTHGDGSHGILAVSQGGNGGNGGDAGATVAEGGNGGGGGVAGWASANNTGSSCRASGESAATAAWEEGSTAEAGAPTRAARATWPPS
jgi:hypothetical protein